jgi:hypothetical protein
MKKFTIALFAMAFLLGACKNETATDTEADATETVENNYKLTPFKPSAEFPNATIESMTLENGKFTYEIGGDGYELGVQTPDANQKMCANSAKGQHIHLILNKDPYIAKYENTFDLAIEDGEYFMLSFLSRSYHESIKTPKAYVAQYVALENGSIRKSAPLTEQPLLFYSRPKGTYVGKKDTEKIMLDFYIINTTLGEDYKVRVDINNQIFFVDTWQPYYIEGLEMGENTIRLTLVDMEGIEVPGPLNPVERTITLSPDPTD